MNFSSQEACRDLDSLRELLSNLDFQNSGSLQASQVTSSVETNPIHTFTLNNSVTSGLHHSKQFPALLRVLIDQLDEEMRKGTSSSSNTTGHGEQTLAPLLPLFAVIADGLEQTSRNYREKEVGVVHLVLHNDALVLAQTLWITMSTFLSRSDEDGSSVESSSSIPLLKEALETTHQQFTRVAMEALTLATKPFCEDLSSLAFTALGGKEKLLFNRIATVRALWEKTCGSEVISSVFWECVVDPALEPITTQLMNDASDQTKTGRGIVVGKKILSFCVDEHNAPIDRLRQLSTIRSLCSAL